MKAYLKTIISSIVALVTSFSLFGCSSNQFDEEKTGKTMEEILTQLFISVQEGDKETFKTFFANQIIELPDFEEGCNYVFEKFQGHVLSVKCNYPMGTGKHIVPGEQICYALTTFDISTNENSYVVYVQFYTKYQSQYPDDQYRISKFKLLNKQQLEAGETYNDCTQRYGIYYLGWLDEEVE